MSIAELYQIAIIEKTSILRKEARLLTVPVRHQHCTLYAWIIQDISVYSGNVSKLGMEDIFTSRRLYF